MALCNRSGRTAWMSSTCWTELIFLETEGGISCSQFRQCANDDHRLASSRWRWCHRSGKLFYKMTKEINRINSETIIYTTKTEITKSKLCVCVCIYIYIYIYTHTPWSMPSCITFIKFIITCKWIHKLIREHLQYFIFSSHLPWEIMILKVSELLTLHYYWIGNWTLICDNALIFYGYT